MIELIIIGFIIGLAATYAIIIYNKIIQGKNHINEAASGIDVQLKRRHDLIPRLITIVKAFAAHEKTLLENVTELRNRARNSSTLEDQNPIEKEIGGCLLGIFALSEDYPDLKSDTVFLDLQKSLVEVEDNIQFARRYYNGTIREFNITVESFPSSLIANFFKFKVKEFFELESIKEMINPKVSI